MIDKVNLKHMLSSEKITVQTLASFQRIEEALTGNTSDDLNELIFLIKIVSDKANKIQEISSCMLNGDC